MFDVCSNTNSLLERYTSNLKRSVLEETTEQKVVDAFSWKSLEIFLLYTTTKAFLSWLKKSPRFAIHKIYPRPVVTQLIDGIRLIRKSSKSNLLELRAKGGLELKLFSGKRRSIIREYYWTADRLREKPTSIIMITLIAISVTVTYKTVPSKKYEMVSLV